MLEKVLFKVHIQLSCFHYGLYFYYLSVVEACKIHFRNLKIDEKRKVNGMIAQHRRKNKLKKEAKDYKYQKC